MDAIAGGADEDEADEAAFLALNPNGVVVDEDGDVLKKGPESAIEVGTKVEFEESDVEQENADGEIAVENDKEYFKGCRVPFSICDVS